MEISLNRLMPGCGGVVTKMECRKTLRHRLWDFGLVPGTLVQCRYRSPDGGLTAIELRGTVLALRTRDLENIRVLCQ